jgi:hypothetical protein
VRVVDWAVDKFRSRTANGPVEARTGVQSSAGPDPSQGQAPIKVKPQQTLPSYLTTAKPDPGSPLTRAERNTINTDLTTSRSGRNTFEVIRNFVRGSPDMSAAVTSYVRTGITSGYTAVARNRDRTVNREATAALDYLLTWLNVMNDYAVGFDDSPSIRSLCETWAREILHTGAMCGELVLNKARLPDKIQIVSESQIKLFPSSDGKRLIPKQVIAGNEISLDIPTFFRVTLDQDVLNAYSESPIESALQAVLFSADFMNDIRRIVKKAIHPRVVVTIDEAKFVASMPPEIKNDTEKAVAYRNDVIAALGAQINGLEPEEALVIFDSLGIDVVDHGNTNLSAEYKVVQDMADSKMATGTKVLPTVLGHSSGTANTASAEVLMFVKYVEGTIWGKLNEMLSKILTLAVRLYGFDVVVEFRFNDIELRPASELEAFRSMKQSRVLDLLSLGFVSDDDAALDLTGHLPPATFKPLSGTGFRASAQSAPAGTGYNGATNDGSTMNQSLKPGTPTQTKTQKAP